LAAAELLDLRAGDRLEIVDGAAVIFALETQKQVWLTPPETSSSTIHTRPHDKSGVMRRVLWLSVMLSVVVIACNKRDSELRPAIEAPCRWLEEDLSGKAHDYHRWIAAGHSDDPPPSLWVHPLAQRLIEGTFLKRQLNFCTNVRTMDKAEVDRVAVIFDVATDRYSSAQSPSDVVAEVDVMLAELKKLNALPLRD
jgi:hypothetical protein